MDERPETPADGEIVEHAILSQQRSASIQQFIENLNVGNPGSSFSIIKIADRLFWPCAPRSQQWRAIL
jgi:hypothetical protein